MPAKRSERVPPPGPKGWGTQRRALETTIRALRSDDRVEPTDAAHIQTLRVLADRIDSDRTKMSHRDLHSTITAFGARLDKWLDRLDERRLLMTDQAVELEQLLNGSYGPWMSEE